MNKIIKWIVHWGLIALGIAIASHIIPGVNYEGMGALFIAVVLLSIFNVILKPILVFFTLPFIVLTFGVGVLVINAFLFVLVGKLVNGFTVESFWAAFFASLIVSAVTFVVLRMGRSV